LAKYSLVREFWDFCRVRKKYWLLPIIAIICLLAVLVVTSPAISPFIYTIF